MKIIFDAGNFGEDILKVQNSDDLDDFIQNEDRKTYRLMEELVLEEDIIDILTKESQPERVLALAETLDYDFFKDYLRHKIDLGNLKILLRAKYSDLLPEKYGSMVMGGGFLEESLFVQSYGLPLYEIGERLRTTPYLDLWNDAVDTLEEKETFVSLERGVEDFIMSCLRRAKYVVFGPEPIFSYVLAKRKELGQIRLVGVGRLQAIPSEFLKQRISESYV